MSVNSRRKKTHPNTDVGYAIQLKHLVVEVHEQLKTNASYFELIDSDFLKEVYYMALFKGATITLKGVDCDHFTLEICGIKVILDPVKKVQGILDPNSIAVIDIFDCGYKICASLRIGQFDFSPAWSGLRVTEIVSEEGIEMMRSLIEAASLLASHHRDIEQDLIDQEMLAC